MNRGFLCCTPFVLFIALLPPHSSSADVTPSSDAEPPSVASKPGNAGNTAKMLEHFRQMAASGYHYEETRVLELVEAPWHGSGYLLTDTDGTLVKLQLSPERIIMAITAQRMYYYAAAQGQRYSAPLDFSDPMIAQVGTLRAVLQGHTAELYADYDIAIDQRETEWLLRLTGKSSSNAGLLLEVSGDDAKPQRKIMIRQPDGEKSEYRMLPASERQVGTNVARLLAEAAGE
ncbi:outer membrane lipoprotein carrier protein LolA [Candidatus Methylospira mobilis]|uniref:outer membrane lipoprotein carrier protein LolA n=1 Tax=Candidatus Methylospira mobilis TaxID=1808979 RepID=UPI0028EEBD8A|nr:outer membrane lipoprotein carrier protein LolA [Candidatus Methylospira mobilis]WNV04037.1 outer membrane lipoprotein carrier protein LolA [Candidatus Methylospira mobilis]